MNRQSKIDHILARELAWLFGCFAAAVLCCTFGPSYDYEPLPSLTIALYAISAVLRILRRYLRPGRM